MCIFVRIALHFSTINISHNCKGKDWEICAIKLETKPTALIILRLYRATTGDFNRFINNPFGALKYLYKPKLEFLICGDINTDCITESNRKNLVLLLTTYSILHTVSLATGLQNNSSTATDSIFVDNSRINLSSLSPTINDLSVHDAHILTINVYI